MYLLKMREIFTPKRLTIAFINIFIYMCLFIFLEVLIMKGVYADTYKEYANKLNNIVKTEGLDLSLMCNIVECKGMEYDNVVYKNDNGFITRTNVVLDTEYYWYNVNRNFETILESNNVKFVIENNKFIHLTTSVLFSSTLIFLLFSIIIYVSKIVSDYKTATLEKGSLKIELESKLQRDITESLHHEIGTPLAIIATLLENLYRYLYPCGLTEDGVCDFKNEYLDKKACEGCQKYSNGRKVDSVAIDHYYKIKFSIDRLNSIQNLIAGSKHIKYSNGTVAIYDIIDNIVSTNNSFKVNKVQIEYKNLELFNKYACGLGLSNGELLLIMHAMVTNSIEAKSTNLCFSVNSVDSSLNIMEIIIADNGRGIRNALDEIIDDKEIFDYGYSTKDISGENIRITNWFKKLIFKLGWNQQPSSRGAGISVNKRILENSGGKMELVSTSRQGTKFKITIPIKIRRI